MECICYTGSWPANLYGQVYIFIGTEKVIVQWLRHFDIFSVCLEDDWMAHNMDAAVDEIFLQCQA